ncbi:MAG: hypothetical protein LBU75_02760 [Desulfovibrio sp.]|jgi:hypothetical protein|nr:hypothetical protein [Desulfovibrio sp.]
MPPAETLRTLARAACSTTRDAFQVWLTLVKVMVPIIIVVKVLTELDLVRYLALPLSPIMGLVGLPADLGLSWATSMLVNIYSGLFVYAGLLPGMEQLSVAQVTTFATMTLIAHNVLVEGRIAQQCGLNMTTQIVLRFGGALLCGMLMRAFFDATGYLSEPAAMLWAPREAPATLAAWAWNEARNLVSVFGIVLVLMGLMRVLDAVGITKLLNACLRPVLRLMGIGDNAATITIVGLGLGIAYGGGLIVHEVQGGKVPPRDVFSSLSLMGLSHALIEDTLLMTLIGAHLGGTLWGRLIFSMVVVMLLIRLYDRLRPTPSPVTTASMGA